MAGIVTDMNRLVRIASILTLIIAAISLSAVGRVAYQAFTPATAAAPAPKHVNMTIAQQLDGLTQQQLARALNAALDSDGNDTKYDVRIQIDKPKHMTIATLMPAEATEGAAYATVTLYETFDTAISNVDAGAPQETRAGRVCNAVIQTGKLGGETYEATELGNEIAYQLSQRCSARQKS